MRIVRAQLGKPICYQESFGDVWTTTWADDDALYSVSDDTTGFDQACDSNLAVHRITGEPPRAIRGVTINPMSEFGRRAQDFDEDHDATGTWKASGFTCVDGVLYLCVYRQASSSPRRPVFSVYEAWDASILKSYDHGTTWTKAPKLGRAMFPGHTFATPFFVQYTKDGKGEADGADRFVYAVSSNGVWNNGSSMVLGRVPRDRIGRLDHGDWEFVHGFDEQDQPIWRPRHDTARYIFRAPGRTSMTGIHHVAPLGLYILPQWHYLYLEDPARRWKVTRFEFYQAPAPWGPWTLFHTQDFQPESWYNPCFPSKFISPDGRRLWMFVAGDFTDPGTRPFYRLHMIEVALDVDETPKRGDEHARSYRAMTTAQ